MSYQQSKTCTRPILPSALATKMGQVPTESYTERMKHTQATRHDSKGKTGGVGTRLAI